MTGMQPGESGPTHVDLRIGLVASIASAVGALVMVALFVCTKALQNFPSRLVLNLGLVYVAWFASILYSALLTWEGNPPSCQVLGPVDQFCANASILWGCVLAHHLRALVFSAMPPRQRDSSTHLTVSRPSPAFLGHSRDGNTTNTELAYHCVVWPLSIIGIVVMLLLVSSGDWTLGVSGKCHLSIRDVDYATVRTVRLAVYTGPAALALILNSVVYVSAYRRVREMFPDRLALARRVAGASSRYLLVLVVCWAPSIASDLWAVIEKCKDDVRADCSVPHWLAVVADATFYSQGWMLTLVFMVNRWSAVRPYVCCCASRRHQESRLFATGGSSSAAVSSEANQGDLDRESRMSDASMIPDPHGSAYGYGSSDEHGELSAALLLHGKRRGDDFAEDAHLARSMPTPSGMGGGASNDWLHTSGGAHLQAGSARMGSHASRAMRGVRDSDWDSIRTHTYGGTRTAHLASSTSSSAHSAVLAMSPARSSSRSLRRDEEYGAY